MATPPFNPFPLAPVGFSKVVQTGALVMRAQPPVRHLILILCVFFFFFFFFFFLIRTLGGCRLLTA